MKHMKKVALSACILSILSLNSAQAANNTRIKNVGGKCLDVNGPDLGKTGGKVQIWECNDAPNQQWFFDEKGRINSQGGKCLDVSGSDLHKNGGKVQLWDCNDAPNQQWQFDAAQRLHSAGGKCLDINGPELHKNGGKVQIWDCNDAPNQQWVEENKITQAAPRPAPAEAAPATPAAPAQQAIVNPFLQSQRTAEAAKQRREIAPAAPASGFNPFAQNQQNAAPKPTPAPARSANGFGFFEQAQGQAAAKPVPNQQTNTPPVNPFAQIQKPAASNNSATTAATTTAAVSAAAIAAATEAAQGITEPAAPFTGILKQHNQWRAKVGVAPLKWSDTVAQAAQAWADDLKANNNCNLIHNPNRKYGENIGAGSGRLTPAAIVGLWAAESVDYDYASNSCSPGRVCGHYTQVVWARSTEVGCGAASCGGMSVWVCNYNPMGNYIGQKPY